MLVSSLHSPPPILFDCGGSIPLPHITGEPLVDRRTTFGSTSSPAVVRVFMLHGIVIWQHGVTEFDELHDERL